MIVRMLPVSLTSLLWKAYVGCIACVLLQDYNNVENSMLELVFAPAADWIARSDQDIIDGKPFVTLYSPLLV